MRRTLDLVRVGERGDSVVHRAEVRLEAEDLLDARLHVHGIATVWSVEVNGAAVLSGESMWTRASVDVTPHLRAGVNDVTVLSLDESALRERVAAQPRRPRARWRTRLVEETGWRWVRTTVLGRAPGFAPGPPVVGPYRPVVLETGPGPRVTDLVLRPSLEGSTGVLDVEVAVTGDPGRLELEVTDRTDGVRSVLPLTLAGGRARAALELPDVRRWWPHTHGEPALHRVRLLGDGSALDLPGDGTVPPTHRCVGFRALGNGSAEGRPEVGEASIDLHVNGVPVFCRGAVWTPGDLAALDTAVELGLNLVRVPGIASYESDAFLARCDELGLLVWQDLMLATHHYPLEDPGFAAALEAEVRTEAARLVHHPSAVVVCGSAEQEQQAIFFGARLDDETWRELGRTTRPWVEQSGIDALWVDSSPSGGLPPTRVDTGVAQWFGVGAYLRPLSDARTSGVGFASECLAFANPADPASPGAGDGPAPRDHGADWDFADVREHYLHALHGPDAGERERATVSGELMAAVFGEWRRPASPCGGGIVLWLRDLAPGPGWGLLDHTGRPKPCAAALARALAPVAVWLVDEGTSGLDVHLANDRPEEVAGDLAVRLMAADGRVVEESSTAVSVPPHGHLVRGVDELLGHWTDANHALGLGTPAHERVEVDLALPDGDRRCAVWRARA